MLMQNANEQIVIFMRSVLLGCLLGVVFESVRFVRILFGGAGKKKFDVLTFFCDLEFFFFAAIASSVFIYHRNYGIPRAYIFIGFIIGFALYYSTVGRLICMVEMKVSVLVGKIAGKISASANNRKRKDVEHNEKE